MSKYLDGHTYHVYNRGAHRSSIFRNHGHYHRCSALLQKYADQYHVTMLTYCLMPNHYHLLVQQEQGGTVSRFLQTTFNAYVQYFNVLEGHSGTLFQGAAKSRHIQTDEYLLQVVRYIHCNPVWASLAKTPLGWPFSDYSRWIADGEDSFPGKSLRDAWFKDGKAYREFVEAYRPRGDEPNLLEEL